MAVIYKNSAGKVYYLHAGTTKTGKPKYFFSMKDDGELVEQIPEGFEIYESPNDQVFLRRILPRLISDEEVTLVERELSKVKTVARSRVDRKAEVLSVYVVERQNAPPIFEGLGFMSAQLSERLVQSMPLTAVFQFHLVDQNDRLFEPYRYCYRGSIDDWISVGEAETLDKVVKRYLKHIGKDSYYELF